jgi:signal peptidase I
MFSTDSHSTTLFARLALRALAVLQVSALVVLVGLGCALLAGLLPSLLGDESFVVSNRDMQPALQVGDLAVVGPVNAAAVEVGDIVTYRTPQDPDIAVTRRIVSREVDSIGRLNLGTRGDSDPSTEQVTVAQNAVLGRLVYRVPRLGLLAGFASDVPGKMVLLGLPGLLLAGDWLRSRGRRRRTAAGVSMDDVTRIQGLLDSGQRALWAGFPQLAARAADGVLMLDPRNEAAALLKVSAITAREVDREHVAA